MTSNNEIFHKQSGLYFNKISHSNETNYKLLSIGTRKKLMMTFYGVAYYSDNYNLYNDTINIENKNDNKKLILKFYRAVTNTQIYNAIQDAIKQRDIYNYDESSLSSFYNILTNNIQNFKYMDNLDIELYNDTLYFYYNNNHIGNINDINFAKLLFAIYLDNNSVTPDILYKYQY